MKRLFCIFIEGVIIFTTDQEAVRLVENNHRSTFSLLSDFTIDQKASSQSGCLALSIPFASFPSNLA